MFENDRKETASKAVTSIRHQNDIEKSTWKTHRYVVNFESRIHVEIPTRIVITISTWIHLSKSMKSRRTFHVEFRRCVYWVRNVFEKKKKYRRVGGNQVKVLQSLYSNDWQRQIY